MSDNWLWIKRIGKGVGGLLAFAVLISALVLLIRLLWAPTEIGTPATESEALIRSNERMLDMTKWTISTILLIGGGLIGLNWYSNEHRYREDKSILDDRMKAIEQARNSDLKATLDEILSAQRQILEVKFDLHRVTDQLSNVMLMPDGHMPSKGYVAATIDLIRKPGVSSQFKERALDKIVTMFGSVGTELTFLAYLGLNDLPELAEEADRQGFSEQASKLRIRFTELRGTQEVPHQ